jgi:hypothetical protein
MLHPVGAVDDVDAVGAVDDVDGVGAVDDVDAVDAVGAVRGVRVVHGLCEGFNGIWIRVHWLSTIG